MRQRDRVVAEEVREGVRESRRRRRVVVGEGESIEQRELRWPWAPGSVTLGGHDAPNSVKRLSTGLVAVGANVELQGRIFGNHVAFRASFNAADCQHRSLARRRLPRHHGLQSDHDHRGEHHWVDGRVWHRTVTAAPMQGDPHAVGRRENRTGLCPDLTCGRRQHVLRERHVGLRDELREAVVDHAARAIAGFLRRLKYGDERAAPFFDSGKQIGGAE